MKTKLLRRLRREGRCQINIYSVRKDMDGTVVGIRYGYNSDEYAHLWHFAMTSDELKSEAMKIYILRRIAELKGKRKMKKVMFNDRFGFTLEEVMQQNLDKLASRRERGVIDGNGDNR